MAGPVAPLTYWFPGAPEIPAPLRARFGLEPGGWGALPGPRGGAHHAQIANAAGPGDGRGLLAAVGDLGPDPRALLRYDPEAQDWSEVEVGVWCGVAKAATARDFLREGIVPSPYSLRTARGEWIIPVAVVDSAGFALPQEDRLVRGEWHRVPAPAYKDLCADALLLYRVEKGEAELPAAPWLRNVAVRALQCNYALTPAELACLGVLADASYDVIAQILTDRPSREKKTA